MSAIDLDDVEKFLESNVNEDKYGKCVAPDMFLVITRFILEARY